MTTFNPEYIQTGDGNLAEPVHVGRPGQQVIFSSVDPANSYAAKYPTIESVPADFNGTVDIVTPTYRATVKGDGITKITNGYSDSIAYRPSAAALGKGTWDSEYGTAYSNGTEYKNLDGSRIELATYGYFYPKEAVETMTVPSPYAGIGDGTILHQKMQTSATAFGGYKYWMSFTPLNNYSSDYENPCIVASNDQVTWVAPAPNPVIPYPSVPGYHNDVHIAFNADESKLYMIFVTHVNSTNASHLKICYTTDGISWTEPVIIRTTLDTALDTFGSPSFFWDPSISKWVMYSHQLLTAPDYQVQRSISITDDPTGAWGDRVDCVIPMNVNRQWWHSDFIRDNSGIIYGVSSETLYGGGGVGGGMATWLLTSVDGLTFTTKVVESVRSYRPSWFTDLAGNVALINGWVGSPVFTITRSRTKSEEARRIAYKEGALSGTDVSIARDTFTRDDSALTIGSTENGLPWNVYSVGNVGKFGISSNRLYNVNSTRTSAIVSTVSADGYLEMTFEPLAAGSGAVTLLARSTNESNMIRFGFFGTAQLQMRVSVTVAGVQTNTDIPVRINFALTNTLGVRMEGNQFDIYLNNVFIKRVFINDFVNVKSHGVLILNTTGSDYIDNFMFLPLNANYPD